MDNDEWRWTCIAAVIMDIFNIIFINIYAYEYINVSLHLYEF